MSEYPVSIHAPRTAAAIAALQSITYSTQYQGVVGLDEKFPVAYCSSAGLRTDVTRSAQKATDSTGRPQRIVYAEEIRMLVSLPGEPEVFAQAHESLVLPDYDRRRAICSLAVNGHVPVEQAWAIIDNATGGFDIDQMIKDTYDRLFVSTPHGYESRRS